jgi:predicted negative regulator of RcsB-dependent stress response
MAKQPTSSPVRRDNDVPDDAFVGTIRRVVSWGKENTRQLTIGGGAILIIAAVAVWMVVQQRQLETTAQTRLTQVQQTVASGNPELAIRDLRSYLDTFGGTDASDQARLLLADLLISQEQPQQAIEALGTLPDRLDDPFGLAAARLEAAALERTDQHDAAIQAYRQIADNARFPYQRREALADAARLELQRGQPAAAVGFFEEIVGTFDADEAGRGYYELWLAEARAQAQAGQGSPGPTQPAPDTDAGDAPTG